MNDRDMFYNSYGYGGYAPPSGMAMGMPTGMPGGMMDGSGMGTSGGMSSGMMTNQMMPNNYATGQLNDMNERVSRLERQIKRLDQRLTRLETPYANANNMLNNEPDNNMYMM